ncbi:MAG TPA: A/G-specific adenine glycosylase [Flavobacteriales bacterium]|nr:A/G-specific adenine glycosylase [Flavobacteriales bacterium]
MSTAWFNRALLPWYREHKRALPWRETRDPYRIWLSEVILQQTRVDQGLAYWLRFVERYPTVAHLAKAPEDAVLKLWQGLGYYSRARNLRTAAQQVVNDHGGVFPADYARLKGLKGVGEYTAAAIGSIAFGLVEPVVDGNVYRVLARVFGIATPIDSTEGRKEFRALAATLIDHQHPGDHNQAVMELGATVCTPRNPRCGDCPFAPRCIARGTGRIAELPVKAGKATVRVRHFNYLHIRTAKGTYLQKRTGKDIWQGLYELPLIETERAASKVLLSRSLDKLAPGGWIIEKRSGTVVHLLSHQRIETIFWEVVPPKRWKVPKEWLAVTSNMLNAFAVPRLIERYLNGAVTG